MFAPTLSAARTSYEPTVDLASLYHFRTISRTSSAGFSASRYTCNLSKFARTIISVPVCVGLTSPPQRFLQRPTDNGPRTSFVPQNLHRIQPGRRERRVESRQKAYSECRERDPQPIQRAGVEGYRGERVDIRLERD